MLRNPYMYIRGRVIFNQKLSDAISEGNSIVNGIGIRLYRISGMKKLKTDGLQGDIKLFRENMILKTFTDKNGEYGFMVPSGWYSLCIDTATLPKGTGPEKSRLTISPGVGGENDFILTDVKLLRKETFFNASDVSSDNVSILFTAYRNGTISRHEAVQHYIQYLIDPEVLPLRYRPEFPLKSGTGMAEEIRRYMGCNDADAVILNKARSFFASSVPELDKTYTSAGGFFRIHYTTTGKNAVPADNKSFDMVPEYIGLIGEAFDNVKSVTCGQRGFRTPITEKGRSFLDIYVFDLKGKYGVTYGSGYQNTGKRGIRTSSCYICVDNDYSQKKGFKSGRNDCMMVTAAHEFFHAVQYAYNTDADIWWKEASATWNEDEVYTGINDYIRYLGSYFSNPRKSIEESSYGGVVFAKFLSERCGGYDIIKSIWEAQGHYDDSLKAIDSALKGKKPELSLASAFNEFTACNYSPEQYYAEGALWKAAAAIQDTHTEYPVTGKTDMLDHMSSCYHLFRAGTDAAGKALKLVIDGKGSSKWGFKLQKKSRDDKQCHITEIATNGDYDKAEITINGFYGAYEEVCLIPANLDSRMDNLKYSYSAELI